MLVAKHSNSGTNLMDAEYKFEGNVSIICTYTILLRVLLSPIYTWWFRPFSRRGLIICIILYYMSHSDIIIYFVAWPFLLSLIHFSSVSITNRLWNSTAFEGNLFVLPRQQYSILKIYNIAAHWFTVGNGHDNSKRRLEYISSMRIWYLFFRIWFVHFWLINSMYSITWKNVA